MGELLENFKIGLVLSGGGAKGAYESGVIKTLWELELINNINVISGTSVGSVNALLLSMNDRNVMSKSWNSLSYSRFINNEGQNRNIQIQNIIKKIKNINLENSIVKQLLVNDIGILSQDGIKDFIEEYVDINVIKSSKRDIFACAYNIDKERPEYFNLNQHNHDEILNIVLASCAIPYIFKPIVIDGCRYADGGINSHEYSKNNVDNVPINPLINYECDLIIVVHLSNKNTIDKNKFKKDNIIEIYPSKPIEFISGTGGLMINKNKLRDNVELGYRDSMTILAPIILNIVRGKNLDELLKNRK